MASSDHNQQTITPDDPVVVEGNIPLDEVNRIAFDKPIDSSESLLSSILQYHVENGRTYHSLNAGKYALPNDEGEQERLDLLNHLFQLTYDGRFCLSPKNEGASNVLDMGTGTGMWAIDYADAHPESRVLGVDLSPIQPFYVRLPPNCQFEIDDLEDEWNFDQQFDLIFARSLATAFSDWSAIMLKAFNHLEPGGYFEIHDNTFPALSDDNTLPPDCALMKWCTYMIQGARNLGRPLDDAPRYPRMLEAVGFEDVVVRTFKWPTNRWPRSRRYKEMGSWALTALDGGLEGLCMGIFTRGLGWSREDTVDFCARVRTDLRNPSIHAYWQVVVTYARKPEEKVSPSESVLTIRPR